METAPPQIMTKHLYISERILSSLSPHEPLSECSRKARAFQLLATTLLPEQPNIAQPIMTMISPIPQFFLRIDRPGSAQVGAGLNS